MYAIAAANKNILDVDLVFEGQSLNIPLVDKNSLEVYYSCHNNSKGIFS